MDSTSPEEAALFLKFIHSIPYVFRDQGNPDDLNFMLSHLKKAVCLRGVSSNVQSVVVELLAPISMFKAGHMHVRELERIVEQECCKISKSRDLHKKRVSFFSA